jgi:hypothetical protein
LSAEVIYLQKNSLLGIDAKPKRLEDGIFRWPKIEDGVMRLSAAQLSALLEGLDWRRVHDARETAVIQHGANARSASKPTANPSTATHCTDESIVRLTRVTVRSRLDVKSRADLQASSRIG